MSEPDPNQPTRKHDRIDPGQTRRHTVFDPEQTVRNVPIKRDDLALTQATEPVRSAEQIPPAQQVKPSVRRKLSKRRRGCVFLGSRVGVGIAIATLLTAIVIAGLYIVIPPSRVNVLILGLDSRAGQGKGTRTDTIILVTIDPAQPYIGMLSIPRDLYVNIPGYGMNRINAANVLGEATGEGNGIGLAAKTITENFGISIHRTVRLDFEGFIAIVDAAGGITVNVPSSFIDYAYPTADYGTMVVEFSAGTQQLDGERALQYARVRHGSSDFVRAERQQQVIDGLVRTLLWPGNWHRLPAVYSAFVRHIESDITIVDVLLMAPAVMWVQAGGIEHEVLDRDYVTGAQTAAGASIQQPNWDRINPLIDEMFGQ